MPNRNSPKLPLGTLIGGKYRVERYVGDGGMGQVVAARHLVLNELVAIKFMHHQDLENPLAALRFIREAQAVARLKNNEHVARVHDVGKNDSGDLYIVMDLLLGQDLGDVVKNRGVLPIHEACSYVLQACNALVEAHDLGIIHRDLKPTNLFLTHRKDGSPCIKVLDFGISKVLVTDGPEADVEMTGTREMMGSPLYMSPEQAKSARDVDLRTDIWALGAILYKLLTGSTPFGGQTVAEVSFALLEPTAVRPPSELRPDIPRQLEACILRCLEKNVHRRYRRVSELMAALRPFASRQTNLAEDEDNVATVLHPIGKSRTNTDGAGSTMLIHEAHVDQWDAQESKRQRERSGTDVLPARQASARVRNDLAPSGEVYPRQSTQPLNGHALRAAIEAFRPAAHRPNFTERVHLPPVSAHPSPPAPAAANVATKPGPFPLKASFSFQGPAINPPPIPPTFPTGGYPIAPTARVTLPSGSRRLPISEFTEPPQEREGAKRNRKNARSTFVRLAVVFGIFSLVITAFVLISAYAGQPTAASETAKSASASAAAPPNKPGSLSPSAAINPTNGRDSTTKTIGAKPNDSPTK